MPQLHSHIQRIGLAAFFFLLFCIVSGRAEARLLGEVELGYTTFTADRDNVRVLDASSFTQRYSVLYVNNGLMGSGRMGKYSLALGYEWASFDTTIKTQTTELNPSVSGGHINYNGEVNIAPRELPFRIKAFSRNLDRITFQSGTLDNIQYDSYLMNPEIISDLHNGGQSITSGATLLLGVKNGMTNGYNALFKELPIIYADYRDDIINDKNSQVKIDTRLQKLAFVSLNKKDNWFHYRTTRYYDYINSSNNYITEDFQIGTVDHTLKRQWIPITNWINISVDGQHSKTVELNNRFSEGYDVNLFGTAVRRNWEMQTYNTFSRRTDNGGISYDQQMPLFLKGILNADTDWSVRSACNINKYPDTYLNAPSNRRDILTQAQLNTFKRALFNLTTNMGVEHIEENTGTNIILNAGLVATSTPRFSHKFGLGGGYTFTATESDQSKFYQNTITGDAHYSPSQKIRFQFNQTLTVGSGSRANAFITTLPTTQDFYQQSGVPGQPRNEPSQNFLRSVTNFSLAFAPLSTLRFTISADEDYYKDSNREPDSITNLRGMVDYVTPKFLVRGSAIYTLRNVVGIDNSQSSANVTAKYSPNRNLDTSINVIYEKLTNDSSTIDTLTLKQDLNFKILSNYAYKREILLLTEEVSYWRSNTGYFSNTLYALNNPADLPANEYTRFSLRGTYYPLRNLYLKLSSAYNIIKPDSQKQFDGSAGIGVDYQKLKASVDYSYGRRDGVDKRIEKRLMANLKKFF